MAYGTQLFMVKCRLRNLCILLCVPSAGTDLQRASKISKVHEFHVTLSPLLLSLFHSGHVHPTATVHFALGHLVMAITSYRPPTGTDLPVEHRFHDGTDKD